LEHGVHEQKTKDEALRQKDATVIKDYQAQVKVFEETIKNMEEGSESRKEFESMMKRCIVLWAEKVAQAESRAPTEPQHGLQLLIKAIEENIKTSVEKIELLYRAAKISYEKAELKVPPVRILWILKL